ncbi:MAG TPA: vitamin K epoxide reductase family protein [Streptosporangiaceae bacterium]|nr:vitamin K epoxide reductase family protein [Streptosporangiaceae bacterium]
MSARKPGTAARSGPRDKGTRGGRPEPQLAGQQARAATQKRANSAQARSSVGRQSGNGQARTATAAAKAKQAEVVAGNGQATAEEPGGPRVPLWFRLTTLVLSLLGLADSIWVTIDHYTPVPLGCSDKGAVNCAQVLHSPQSVIFGIPLPILGLAFFVFMVAANSPWGWRVRWPAMGTVRLASVIVGMVFVLYLVYTELITIRAICLYCTGVHIITFLLFVLTMFAVSARYITVILPKRR